MNRDMLREHLALAEKHVELGARHIATQKAIIGKFVRDGMDTTVAQQLLDTFEDMQGMHIADRDRLEKELAETE